MGWLDFPQPMQSAERRKWPNAPSPPRDMLVWSRRRGAMERVWGVGGGGGTKAQYVGLSPESRAL